MWAYPEQPQIIAAFLSRVFLGIVLVFQGYDKIFDLKIKTVVSSFIAPFKKLNIHKTLIYSAVYYTSFVEFFGGIMLIFGIYKYIILYLISIDLLIIATGFGLLKPMWDMTHVFPRLILILILLIIPIEWDVLSIDMMLKNLIK